MKIPCNIYVLLHFLSCSNLKISSHPASFTPEKTAVRPTPAWLQDGDSQIFRLYGFGPLGFWTMAPLRYAAKFDFLLSLDCAPRPSTLAQSKGRKGSNFAIWQPCTPVCGSGVVAVGIGSLPLLPSRSRPTLMIRLGIKLFLTGAAAASAHCRRRRAVTSPLARGAPPPSPPTCPRFRHDGKN